MRLSVALACFALLGCGNSSNSNAATSGGEANEIADRFEADCRAVKAPNAQAARDLDKLCTCSTKQIRSTIHDGDSREVTDVKIDQARMDCVKQVYPNG